MASSNKVFIQLQDFVAHSSNVNCLALGHKSAHVLVTGGEDKKVNLWAVGKSNCIMSLSGHSWAISSVRFGHSESQVAAGSSGGTIKIWDLEEARIRRSLSGHKGPVSAIEFHPFSSDMFTSASTDATVKLWDIRNKGCVFTYRGHTGGVKSVRFSPDGLWIASGGDEGAARVWDLRSGRLVSQLNASSGGGIVALEFHPHEFLLAAATMGGSVHFWDLEHFSLISASPPDQPANPKCLLFSSGGECVYVGGVDALRTQIWEPPATLASLNLPWGNIADIALCNSTLVGASYGVGGSSVGVWMVDTTQLTDPQPFTHSNPLRKSFNRHKPATIDKSTLSVKTIEESERSETDPEDESIAVIQNVNDYRAIFQPKRNLTRSPPPPPAFQSSDEDYSQLSNKAQQCALDTSDDEPISPREEAPTRLIELNGRVRHYTIADTINTRRGDEDDLEGLRRRSVSPGITLRDSRRNSAHEPPNHEQEFPVKLSSIHHSASETSIPRSTHQRQMQKQQIKSTSQSNLMVNRGGGITGRLAGGGSLGGGGNVRMEQRIEPPRIEPPRIEPSAPPPPDFIPMCIDRPTGLDLDDFLIGGVRGVENEMSEAEVLSFVMGGHDALMTILETRSRSLKIVYNTWHTKDLKSSVETAVGLRDKSVVVDFLGIITNRPGLWNLDICVLVLPVISELIQSKFETYIRAGVEALGLIVRNFSAVIRTNVLSGSSALGVDISREERYNKCMACYNSLVGIRAFLLKRQTLQGSLGQSFRDLCISLQAIDT